MIQFKVDKNGHCVIPEGTQIIEEKAFEYYSFLRSIEIPDSVTTIGEYLFCGNFNISSLIIHYKEPDKVPKELPISEKISLHVPIGTGYAYRHHPSFAPFKEIIADVR